MSISGSIVQCFCPSVSVFLIISNDMHFDSPFSFLSFRLSATVRRSICISVFLSGYPSVRPLVLPGSVILSVCLTVVQPVRLSSNQLYFFQVDAFIVCRTVCLSVRPSVRPSVRLSVRTSVCLPACLSVCLSVCPSVCLSVCLPVCLSSTFPKNFPRHFLLPLRAIKFTRF